MRSFAEGTLDDEIGHIRTRMRVADTEGLDEGEWRELGDDLVAISELKIRERNEQFGCVLTEDELRHASRDTAAGRSFLERNFAWLVPTTPG